MAVRRQPKETLPAHRDERLELRPAVLGRHLRRRQAAHQSSHGTGPREENDRRGRHRGRVVRLRRREAQPSKDGREHHRTSSPGSSRGRGSPSSRKTACTRWSSPRRTCDERSGEPRGRGWERRASRLAVDETCRCYSETRGTLPRPITRPRVDGDGRDVISRFAVFARARRSRHGGAAVGRRATGALMCDVCGRSCLFLALYALPVGTRRAWCPRRSSWRRTPWCEGTPLAAHAAGEDAEPVRRVGASTHLTRGAPSRLTSASSGNGPLHGHGSSQDDGEGARARVGEAREAHVGAERALHRVPDARHLRVPVAVEEQEARLLDGHRGDVQVANRGEGVAQAEHPHRHHAKGEAGEPRAPRASSGRAPTPYRPRRRGGFAAAGISQRSSPTPRARGAFPATSARASSPRHPRRAPHAARSGRHRRRRASTSAARVRRENHSARCRFAKHVGVSTGLVRVI